MPNQELTATSVSQKIEFFQDAEVVRFEMIQDGLYHVDTVEGEYALHVVDRSYLPAFEAAKEANEWVHNCGFHSVVIEDCGILADLNAAYAVKRKPQGETLRAFLKSATKEEAKESGIRFGQALHRLHDTKLKKQPKEKWTDLVNTTIDLTMYQYSMLKDKGPHDYLLTDFIASNRHLLQKALQRTVVGSLTLDQIRVYDDLTFELADLEQMQIGDDVYDFIFLNDAAVDNPCFSNGVLYGYYGEYPPRNFFRFLSLYTAIVTMQRIVNIQTGGFRKVEADKLMEHEMHIIESFTDFADIIPTWIEPRHMWK